MKKIYYYFLLTSIFFIFSATTCYNNPCENETNRFYTEKVPVKIDNLTNLKVNDTIWISLSVKNQLKDSEGNIINFKIDETYQMKHYFTAEVEINAIRYEGFDFDDSYIEKTGTVTTAYGDISSTVIYDQNTEFYSSNFGLIFKEKGTYRFSTGSLYSEENTDGCPEFSFTIPLFYENGTLENEQTIIFTVD
jgi:hypothetical protein